MDIEEELNAIARNTIDILPDKKTLKERLLELRKAKKPLKIKYGVDPTAPDIHLGHTVVLWKLREFQDLGHIVQFIIGDFTARIGDPSGRNEARKLLSEDVIEKNAKTYLDQVFRILDKKRTKIYYNSEWFGKMNLGEFMAISSHYTVARVLERAEFKDRFVNKQEISLLEFMYPLLQAYDSVMLENDIEIGGTDQTFNLLAGRDLQRTYGQKEQFVITMPLLEGTDGVRKMSKSYGNYIGITESPNEIYGKTMSIPDKLIFSYLRELTPVKESVISEHEENIKNGGNPRDAKVFLAKELVKLYHDKEKAEEAAMEFDKVFKNKELPTDIPVKTYKKEEKVWIVNLLVENKLANNKSEANRLITQGGVEVDGKIINTPNFDIIVDKECIIRVGKRRFLKVIPK